MANLEPRYGMVVEEILKKSVKGLYDLIIAGTTDKSKRLRNLFMGDVVGELIDRVLTSLLLVKKNLTQNSI